MKRIPLDILSKKMFELLSQNQTTPVHDDVPEDAPLPYITFGAFTCKDNGTKVNDISDATINIDIWSEYKGKREVNTIANNVIALLNSTKLDLSEDNFAYIRGSVDFVEAYPEDNGGYHGVITYLVKIQNTKG